MNATRILHSIQLGPNLIAEFPDGRFFLISADRAVSEISPEWVRRGLETTAADGLPSITAVDFYPFKFIRGV